ncbi:MAG: hypothetical protein H6748_12295 [Spirochaetaceae bacterium]|nr:hypothetical protein [Myxococcales bacterium]MCB9724820.1 hypothetical protein [Spirochaetaceae bacterium]HPG24080.1 hypothetical protein [Myxococcota bacterium]
MLVIDPSSIWTTTPRRVGALAALVLLTGAGCLSTPDALAPCDGWESSRAICGLTNPEDLAWLPGGEWVVASEMARLDPGSEAMPDPPGRITAIRARDRALRPLFPAEWASEAPASSGWGDAACPGPPDPARLQPHGLDVRRTGSGAGALAVVNHGGREAVELFEIVDADTDAPRLAWRGCVPMPEDAMTNDVAWLPDGGFVVTKFMPAIEGVGPKAIWSILKVSVGARTGGVLRWKPGGAVVPVAGSEGSAPNGIAASPDGRTLWVAAWGGEAVYQLRLDGTRAHERVEIPVDTHPDNLTWSESLGLVVAGQDPGPTKALGCGRLREGGCDIGYAVYAIDPHTLEARRVAAGRGAASVALEVGDELFVGVFAGDAIERVALPR